MNVLLLYYTGTFNTRYLTDRAQAHFQAGGHTVTRVEINCNTPAADTSGYDWIGFGYPIYAFNSPRPFNRYLKSLRFAPGQRFFIYKNSGETFAVNNASSRTLLRYMKKSRTVFCGEYHFVMPYTIHFPYEQAFVREILEKDEKLLKIMLYNLEHGISPRIKSNLLYNAFSAILSVQKFGGFINSFFYKADAEKCTLCQRCVRDCPEQNIRVEGGKIRFGHTCDMCMRCSFFCPANAIRIGFLEGWKVNGDYHLEQIADQPLPDSPYIRKDSRGFYACFVRTFARIDEEYARLFPHPSVPRSDAPPGSQTLIDEEYARLFPHPSAPRSDAPPPDRKP